MPSPGANVYRLVRSMRPVQWTKNLLVFAGLLFSANYGNPGLALRAVAGFALFCLVSGTIYIFNDLVDLEADRVHPRKRSRPLAAGLVSPRLALASAVVIAAASLTASFALSAPFGQTILAYFLVTILYSHAFKHVAILDVILLALGFVLRAIAGVVVIRVEGGPLVPMTPWFVVCVFFAALFIAICKRRQELTSINDAVNHRRVLEEYSEAFLDQMISVATGTTVLSYAMWLIAGMHGDAGTGAAGLAASNANLTMISTLPFVIYGIFRYLYLVYQKSEGGEPERLILKDKPLLLTVVAWLVIVVWLQK
ncbi:decaprenyl-phosphate phosphoribosyltransferase [Candidatus Sumerlaeota bacterium]|nr:decaprenyl-phosphate phosphoribosyltransferase [Candidatus Sumerlaeota bacterium]